MNGKYRFIDIVDNWKKHKNIHNIEILTPVLNYVKKKRRIFAFFPCRQGNFTIF